MKPEKLKEIIRGGEGVNVEFKQSKNCLNRDVFQSVCAFLNRNGGHLLLGVDDSGNISGLDNSSVDKVKMEFVTSVNNQQKLCPTFYLSVEDVTLDGKTVLYVFVPERKVNLDRYDDRDDIRVNLMESYERLMQFISKHLNDTF